MNDLIEKSKAAATYKYKLNEILERATKSEYRIIMNKLFNAGITTATISRIRNVKKHEAYSPNDDTLTTICDVLNTTTFDIKN